VKPQELAWAKEYRKRRGAELRVIRYASYLVHKAVRHGLLSHPTANLCVDCGDKANTYDHRFYTRPLDVEPVCFSCNKKRGESWDLEVLRLELA
jgi:hypothetical protein